MSDLNAIKALLGNGHYLDQPQDMEPYTHAWRGGWKGSAALVAFPTSTEQVSKLVKLCRAQHITIIPQGGNTGLVGGSVGLKNQDNILINLSKMNKIRDINPFNFTLTAEAGCILQDVQEAAETQELLFPLSMASEGSCEVGGVVSTNAGGTGVLRYGNTRDLVLGLEVVLPNGEIFHGLKQLRKDNTGYDLKQLFIGAEGTLGIVTAAVFKLFPRPLQTETALVALSDAAAAIPLLKRFRQETGDTISAFELISHQAQSLVTTHLDARPPFPQDYPYSLLIELSSSQKSRNLREELEQILAGALEDNSVMDAIIAESVAHANDFWFIREHISEAEKKEGRGIHFDVSIPISDIATFMHAADAEIQQALPQAQIIAFGHIGDGNIHYNLCLPKDMTDADFQMAKTEAKTIVYNHIHRLHGSISAEHGIGIERRDDLHHYKSDTELSLMRAVKHALDPEGLMNPGKMV